MGSDSEIPQPTGRAASRLGSCSNPDPSLSIVFGPVPSRRLGRSLGINNIPPKICSYSCLYCQVGPTLDRSVEPRAFYRPELIASEVTARVEHVHARGDSIDYLAFVPDGEPTLDANLGETIRLLRPLGIEIAVISNGSLLWRADVREALTTAGWVSVKVDTATETTWRRLNRPHPSLDFAVVQDGVRRFAKAFGGDLVSETMLVGGINDTPESIGAVGGFLREIDVQTAYLAIPTRPTPYTGIVAPDEHAVARAYHVLSGFVPWVEYLIGYEGNAFSSSGDPVADLLAITAVHPMRESAVQELLERCGAEWKVVDELIHQGKLAEVTYRGHRYYSRHWR
jgi:wyosine [tRNA(Phe)-imidazoG37] synthetase (radical SAM superfamily)